jgi:hypothetical protein
MLSRFLASIEAYSQHAAEGYDRRRAGRADRLCARQAGGRVEAILTIHGVSQKSTLRAPMPFQTVYERSGGSCN